MATLSLHETIVEITHALHSLDYSRIHDLLNRESPGVTHKCATPLYR